jgi:CheY-like chemotaxis protein
MKKRILIVDDSPLVHQIYGAHLEEAGYEVLHVEDGMTAINTAFREMPDLILLDVHMPKINGNQVCRLLKDHQTTCHIPIIIVTSQSSQEVVVDPRKWSFQTGADGYMDKDSGEKLVTFLNPFLSGKGARPAAGKRPEPMNETQILLNLSKLLDKQLYLDVTRLKELDERKDAFVANVSHEFRSPLAILKGNCELFQDGLLGEMTEKQKKTMDSSRQTIERLLRLVTDLLDLARIEAGMMNLVKTEFDMVPLLDEVVESYQVLADEKKQSVIKEFSVGECIVRGDRDRLIQVVVNILTNSI